MASTPQGNFWDPSGEIRSQISQGLKLLSVRPPDWQAAISNGEWIGYRLEEEIDRVRRDEAAEFRRRQRQ